MNRLKSNRKIHAIAIVLGILVLYPTARADTLYVSIHGSGDIEQFTPAGVGSTFVNGNASVDGMAFDASGNMYVAEGTTVYKITPDGFMQLFLRPGDYVAAPTGVAVDGSGNVYVANTSNNSIYKATPGGEFSVFADLNSFVFFTDNPIHLSGLAFDQARNLYVAIDAGIPAPMIVKITPGGVSSVFATGLNRPFGLAFDSSGNLYVANGGNGTIEKFTPDGTGTVFANTGPTNSPVDLAFDSSSNLFVACTPTNGVSASTILKFTPGGVGSVFASVPEVGGITAIAVFPGLPRLTSATTVTQTMAVDGSSLYLKSDGSVWGLGIGPNPIVSNGVAALGSGSPQVVYLLTNSTLWVQGSFFVSSGQIASNVVAIAPGFKNEHILFIKSDGSLWGAGLNDFGELGDGTTNNASTPEQIVSSGVVAAAAGGDYSLFIKSDTSLWGMGRNDYGQLGDGTTNEVNIPEEIVPSKVVAVSGGFIHTLFAKLDGSLWGMGDDEFGELGDGTYNSTNRPEQILSSGVVAVCCGLAHSLFIKSDGSLWAMGFDQFGELGDNGAAASGPHPYTNQPESIVASNVVAIAAGFYHSLFIKSDGSLWGMGETSGLGFGFSTSVYTPAQIFPGPPAPLLMSSFVGQTNLQFNATCPYGGTYHLLASTNLAQPLSQWAPVATNVVYVPGTNNFSVTLTNAFSPALQQFYILQTQH